MLRDQGTVAIIFIFFFFFFFFFDLCPSFHLKEERGRSQTLFDTRSIYRIERVSSKLRRKRIWLKRSGFAIRWIFFKENITVVVENSMKEKQCCTGKVSNRVVIAALWWFDVYVCTCQFYRKWCIMSIRGMYKVDLYSTHGQTPRAGVRAILCPN